MPHPFQLRALACGSAFVYLGVPAKLICAVVLALLGICTIVFARRIPGTFGSFAWPVRGRAGRLALASIPFLREGDWGVADLQQCRSVRVGLAGHVADSTAPPTMGAHPDRSRTSRSQTKHGPRGSRVLARWRGSRTRPSRRLRRVRGPPGRRCSVSRSSSARRGGLLWRSLARGCGRRRSARTATSCSAPSSAGRPRSQLATFGVLSVFCLRVALDAGSLARERLLAGRVRSRGDRDLRLDVCHVRAACWSRQPAAISSFTVAVDEWRRAAPSSRDSAAPSR